MTSTNEQKVRLATLADEAEFWWMNARQRLEGAGTVFTWEIFREEFLGKYFHADVRNKKDIEFLELKQGSMTMAEHAEFTRKTARRGLVITRRLVRRKGIGEKEASGRKRLSVSLYLRYMFHPLASFSLVPFLLTNCLVMTSPHLVVFLVSSTCSYEQRKLVNLLIIDKLFDLRT